MENWLTILIIFWIIRGIIDYEIVFAYFQREYPRVSKELYVEDNLIAIFAFFVGSIDLLSSLPMGFHKHWSKWR
jgi:hypothetical protein